MYQGSGDATTFAIIVVIAVVVNFIPSFIAFSRDHPQRILILVINLLMGWTIIGWAALLFWATREKKGILG